MELVGKHIRVLFAIEKEEVMIDIASVYDHAHLRSTTLWVEKDKFPEFRKELCKFLSLIETAL